MLLIVFPFILSVMCSVEREEERGTRRRKGGRKEGGD